MMLSNLLSLLVLLQSTLGFFLIIESTDESNGRLISASEKDHQILIAGGSNNPEYPSDPVGFNLEDGVLSSKNGTTVGEYVRDDSYFDVVFQLNNDPVEGFSIEEGYLKFNGSDEFKGCNGFLVDKYVNFLSVSTTCNISSDLKLKVLEC